MEPNQIEEQKDQIIKLLSSVKREGMDNLIEYLDKATFFKDPASAFFYDNYEGGLASHSLKVYKNLKGFQSLNPDLEKYEDSIKVIGLLHDLSMIGSFHKAVKNMPMKGPDGKNKLDDTGRIIWLNKEVYEANYETTLPYPHGQLSNQTIKKYMKLSTLEDLAIFWHHGVHDTAQHMWPLLMRAQKAHKLVFLTYFADQMSHFFE